MPNVDTVKINKHSIQVGYTEDMNKEFHGNKILVKLSINFIINHCFFTKNKLL